MFGLPKLFYSDYCYPWSGVVLDCIDSWSLHTCLLIICSAKTVLNNWGLWQFISNTGNTRLHDLYQHLVKNIREMSEKRVSNGTKVGNQKWQNDRLSMLYSVSDSARDNLVNSISKISSQFLCKILHEYNKYLTNYITNCILCMIFLVKKYAS